MVKVKEVSVVVFFITKFLSVIKKKTETDVSELRSKRRVKLDSISEF